MASRLGSRYLVTVLRSLRGVPPSVLRPYPRLPRTLQPSAQRFAHAIPRPAIPTQDDASSSSAADAKPPRKQLEPHYQLTFTCVPCTRRSTHVVSKQGYHKGSVLISCPKCRNRHVISDNLNIFGDRKITVEDLLREKGQLVRRGTLGEDGDIEFWADDTTGTTGAGEATSASSDKQLGDDEAMRMRETRDPSSHATNPIPSTSGLPGDTTTRPSVQTTSHQDTTPSTRRQYSTKSSNDTTAWKKHIKSARQRSLAFESDRITPHKDTETFRKVPLSNKNRNDLAREHTATGTRKAPLLSRLEAMSIETNSSPSRDVQHLRTSTASHNLSEIDKPPLPQHYRASSLKSLWRKVQSNAEYKGPRLVTSDREYKGPRFIRSDNPIKVTAQITPGVVTYYRPPRGEPIEKPPVHIRKTFVDDLSEPFWNPPNKNRKKKVSRRSKRPSARVSAKPGLRISRFRKVVPKVINIGLLAVILLVLGFYVHVYTLVP